MPHEQYGQYLPHPIILIGAGGVGSHVLPLLVQVGPQRLTIWDDDVFQPVNRQMQLFPEGRIGEPKARVLAEEALRLNPELNVCAVPQRFEQGCHLDGVVLAAVDSNKSRRVIFESALHQKGRIPLFLDGRLSRAHPHYAELYAIDLANEWEVDAYQGWLFDDKEVPWAPRPRVVAAHAPHALTALVGSVLARWVEVGSHPWKVTFDAVALHVEPCYAPA